MQQFLSQCFTEIADLIDQKVPFVCVTMVANRGHAPQDVGAKILVGQSGLLYGTVGGGKVEAKAIAHAQKMLETKPSDEGASPLRQELLVWNLQRDVGMSCGGEVTFYFEALGQEDWQIAVFGAGHVAQKLVPLLLTLQCTVTCLDPRPEWLEKLGNHRQLKKICSNHLPDEIEKLPANTYILLMTQGHALDLPILTRVLQTRRPPYLGVIGSPVKSIRLRKELAEAGISKELCASFHCPMGLFSGSNDPAEIAISMAAQVIQRREELKSANSQERATDQLAKV